MIEHVLQASLERNCMITIIYLKGDEITERNIRVTEISKDKVTAFCYLRKETRIFKKENILSAALCAKDKYGMHRTRTGVGV